MLSISSFSQDVIDAAKNQREVAFTTFGRRTGKPYDVTIFVVTDGQRIFIVSGQGMARQWLELDSRSALAPVRTVGQPDGLRASLDRYVSPGPPGDRTRPGGQ